MLLCILYLSVRVRLHPTLKEPLVRPSNYNNYEAFCVFTRIMHYNALFIHGRCEEEVRAANVGVYYPQTLTPLYAVELLCACV